MKTVNIIDGDSYQELLEKIECIDEKLTSILKNKGNQKVWLTNKEVCEILSVTPRTLQNYRDNGIISFSKVGSKIYYRLTDLENHLEAHLQESFQKRKGGKRC